MYDRLNEKTARLTERVNTYWSDSGLPLRLLSFGSMIRFACQTDPIRQAQDIRADMRHAEDVFMVHVLDNGVLVHASRRGFISTAHTDEDMDVIAAALIRAGDETAADGIF